MRRLVKELGSVRFARAHPVLQAAYGHFGLARIHPFQDGNGRVARALASVYLYRAVSLPLLIYADDRASYLASIHSADSGNRAVLVDFLLQQAVDVMQLITRQLTAERKSRARRGARTMSPWSSLPLEWRDRVPSV
jgi:Fic family protein